MKILDIGNTTSSSYERSARTVMERYAAHVDAKPDDVLLALSFSPLGEQARFALTRSASSLGFGENRLAYAWIAAEGATLESEDVWLLVEGLDPLCLVVADEVASRLVEEAYGETFKAEEPGIVGGRRAAIFNDLEAELGSDEGKQRVWHALKRLPQH